MPQIIFAMPLKDTNNCADYPLGECCQDINIMQKAIAQKTFKSSQITTIDSTWSKKNNQCMAKCNLTKECLWVKTKITTTLKIQ